ncbi:MAG: hypothetical protein AB7V39_26865 [Nitrospiraceae bacterium]
MRFLRYATAAILLTALAGCVVVPMNRTYYEPNPADGTPIRSASCGWHATARDAIEKDVDGITISVFPRYDAGHHLRFSVRLGRTTKAVDIDPEKIEISLGNSATGVRPETTSMRDAGPYSFKSIDYGLSSSPDADEIAITLLPGFIKLDGQDNETTQFRFRRITKPDVYYGSINC